MGSNPTAGRVLRSPSKSGARDAVVHRLSGVKFVVCAQFCPRMAIPGPRVVEIASVPCANQPAVSRQTCAPFGPGTCLARSRAVNVAKINESLAISQRDNRCLKLAPGNAERLIRGKAYWGCFARRTFVRHFDNDAAIRRATKTVHLQRHAPLARLRGKPACCRQTRVHKISK